MSLRSIVWLSGLYASSAFITKLATGAVLLWMARELPVNDYAAVGLLYALQTGIGSFAAVGIGEVVIGALKDHRSGAEQRRLFGIAMTMFAVSALVAAAVGWLLAEAIGLSERANRLAVLTAVVAGGINALATLQAQMLRLREEHLRSLGYQLALPLGMVAGGAAGFALRPGPQAFFIGQALGAAVLLPVLRMTGIGYYALLLRSPAVWAAFRKIPPFFVIAVFGWLSGYGANYMIAAMATPSEVAKYTFLFSVASVMQLSASSFNMAWAPRFYGRVHLESANVVEHENRKFYFLVGLALGMIGGLLLVLLPAGLKFAGGNLAAYSGAMTETFFLFAGYVLLIPFWHGQNYYLAFDKGPELRNVILATGLAGLVAWIVAIWIMGAIGIYVGFALQMLLRALGTVLGAKSIWPIGISWQAVLGGILLCWIGLWLSSSL